jgi:hypothetical protein
MIIAKFEEYDINFGFAIYAFLISILTLFSIIIIWFKKRGIIKKEKKATIIYLALASPLSIFLFIELYSKCIGQYFKL